MRKYIIGLCSVAIGGLLNSSCTRYYKPAKETADIAKVESLQKKEKYFILREKDTAFHMSELALAPDGKRLRFQLDTLPKNHSLYLTRGRNGKMVYRKKFYDEVVLDEVHVFIDSSLSLSNNDAITLPLDQIQRMEIIKRNKGKTTASYILGGLGIATGAVGVIGVIGAITQPKPKYTDTVCSPQLFSSDPTSYKLNGTFCSGAIYKSLQRTEYLPVVKPETCSDQFNLILKGEAGEELMFQKLKLIQVKHQRGQKMLIDKSGKVIVYKDPVAPDHAMTGPDKDVAEDVSAMDDKSYLFTNSDDQGGSSIVLDFKKPAGAFSANLILRGKNSDWAPYVFSEFKKLYGSSYESLVQKKDKESPSKVLQCAINQRLPLLVYVDSGNGWEFTDFFFTPGHGAPRNLIMHLNLDNCNAANYVKIKLQTAYMFWELDYAAMDFSEPAIVSVSYLSPSKLFKTTSQDQLVHYDVSDSSLIHVNRGEQLHLSFDVNEKADPEQTTYFMAGSGYYHDNLKVTGKPQISYLKKCAGKFGFDRFSREKFLEWQTNRLVQTE